MDHDTKDLEREGSDVSHPNKEGEYHQSQLGPKPSRKHFFSPLDPAYADAVNRDAETVQFTEAEERAVKHKIDVVVLPLIVCSYIFNQFDRTNIGNAHTLAAFNNHFGITDNNKWTLVLSIFYVGYFLQRYIGANRFFFLSLNFWGIASLSVVYAKGYAGLLVLRVLMGIGEAGYYAGMIYYLSFWYKKHELAMRISLCMTGTLPGGNRSERGSLGLKISLTNRQGLLAFGLVRAKTSLLTGWQFLFLIEAIPTIIMAFVILLFLPSFPFSATFLTPRERAIAQARLNRDHKPQSHGGMTGWKGFKVIIADLNAWLFMTVYASFNVGVATISLFYVHAQLIKNLGFTAINAQGLTVAPYVVGWLMVVFQAFHSDRTRDRGYHIMLSCAISLVGYIILATSHNTGAKYFAMFLVIGGLYSLFPLVMSWAANAFSPTSKRGVGTAFIVSISNCVSIASPQVYFDPEDDYRKAHAISAGCLALSFLAAFTLRTRLAWLNKRNAKRLAELGEKERKELEETEEIWDTDPRYVFMT
ncbi:MFS general substrate transporter [Mycena venus]|uniref:MFS general substrate transporter n=1 Tax=Mycena venus TaxID=2733690 RepID=A0A8H6XKB0_9AGAR|nr:MFS general substrate transporter [Mycena venus]